MRVQPEITFRDVPHTASLEASVRQQMAKLERYYPQITSCRVAIEQPQRFQRSGNPWRVRVDVTVPPGHELVVERAPLDEEMHARLETVVLDAFKAMRKQLQALKQRQRGETKTRGPRSVRRAEARTLISPAPGPDGSAS